MPMPPDEALRRGQLQAAVQRAIDDTYASGTPSGDAAQDAFYGELVGMERFLTECGDPAVPLFVLEETAAQYGIDSPLDRHDVPREEWGALPAADDDLVFDAPTLALPAELVEAERLPMPVAILRAGHTTIRDVDTGRPVEVADASDEQLGEWLALEKRLRDELRIVKANVDAELVRRMDESKHHTITVERGDAKPLKLSAPSPTAGRKVDDGQGLYDALKPFVGKRGKDGLTEAALLSAVEPVMTYKVKMAGVNAIMKTGGKPAEAAKPFIIEPEGARSVSVK